MRCQIRIEGLPEAVKSTADSPQESKTSQESAKVENVLSFVIESPNVTIEKSLGKHNNSKGRPRNVLITVAFSSSSCFELGCAEIDRKTPGCSQI